MKPQTESHTKPVEKCKGDAKKQSMNCGLNIEL